MPLKGWHQTEILHDKAITAYQRKLKFATDDIFGLFFVNCKKNIFENQMLSLGHHKLR